MTGKQTDKCEKNQHSKHSMKLSDKMKWVKDVLNPSAHMYDFHEKKEPWLVNNFELTNVDLLD